MNNSKFYRKGLILTTMIVAVWAAALASGCTTVRAPAVSASQVQPTQMSGGGPNGSQPAAVVNQAAPSTARGITVVGMGQASGTPDVAHVNVGVETQAETVQQAVADNKAKMASLLETLQGLSIADKDIQTTNYGVYTQRQPNSDGKSLGPTTYNVNNQVNVTVRDVNKLGDVLDKVVTAGANNIYGVSFSVADTTKLESDARSKAFADAKSRAESLARLAGVSLGEVVSVSEVLGGPSPVYEGARMAAATGLGGGAPIQPGELDVNMSIQVTFAIK